MSAAKLPQLVFEAIITDLSVLQCTLLHTMVVYNSLSDQLSKFISELATTINDSCSSSSSSSSSSEVMQWCATGVWPNCSGQYSWVLVPKTSQSYADLCSAWPQLAAVDSPTVQQAGYSAYLIVHPAGLTAAATAAAAAASGDAQPIAAKYGVPRCDAPWASPPPPPPPVRANSAAAPAAVAMPLHRGHSGASGAVHAGVGVQPPVMRMLPPLHAPLLRQLTPEAFRLQGTATAAAAADSSKNIDALHRVARRHSSSSSDNVESASSRSSDKQYSSSAAQKQKQQQQRQGSKRSRSPPASQRRDSSSSSSSSATSSSYRHRTSYGDEISYKSFAADARYDDSHKQHSSYSSGSVSSSYKHAAYNNSNTVEKRARYDSRSSSSDFCSRQASSSSRYSRSRSRSSSRERSAERGRRSMHSDQSRKRSGDRSTSSSRTDESRGEREATRQRSSSVTEQRYVAVQPLTALSSTDAYNARKQARAAAVAAAKTGSSSTVAVAAVAAVEPSVVSPAASPTLLPAARADLCAELNSIAVAALPVVSVPMQPVRRFIGTSVLPQCEPVLTAALSTGQTSAVSAPTATVGAALPQPSTSSSSGAQWHDGATASADAADAFAKGCAQVSSNGPVQCPPSWSNASTSPKERTLTSTASTQPCVITQELTTRLN
jgi:hypothetical protein